jgi:hypothetical protein
VDEACVGGFLDACDLAQLVSDICVYEINPLCTDLLAQGRVRRPEDAAFARAVDPPAALLGCFVIDDSAGCQAASCGPPEERGRSYYCFEKDRVSTKSWPYGWDQLRTAWTGYQGVGLFWVGGMELRLEDGVVRSGKRRLDRAPESVTREAAALPRVEQVCAAARRCKDALRPARPASRPSIETEAESEEPAMLNDWPAELGQRPGTLRACQTDLEVARRAAAGKQPSACP